MPKLWSPQNAGSTGRRDLTGDGHGLGKWSSLVKLTPTTHMAVPESGTRRKCPGGGSPPCSSLFGEGGVSFRVLQVKIAMGCIHLAAASPRGS